MTTQLFTPSPDGKSYDMHPAAALLIMAGDLYADPCELSEDDQRMAHLYIDSVLSAARAGGFKQCDILATLLACNEVSPRVLSMAISACEAAGWRRLVAVMDSLIAAG